MGESPHDHAVQSNPLVVDMPLSFAGIPGIDGRILRSAAAPLPFRTAISPIAALEVIQYYVERRMEYDCRPGPSFKAASSSRGSMVITCLLELAVPPTPGSSIVVETRR
jgi:hypothetical protein